MLPSFTGFVSGGNCCGGRSRVESRCKDMYRVLRTELFYFIIFFFGLAFLS